MTNLTKLSLSYVQKEIGKEMFSKKIFLLEKQQKVKGKKIRIIMPKYIQMKEIFHLYIF